MLPFLKNKEKSIAGLIIKKRQPDEVNPDENQEDSQDSSLDSAAQDLLSAIENKDSQALVTALKSVIDLMNQAPSEEPSMTEDIV